MSAIYMIILTKCLLIISEIQAEKQYRTLRLVETGKQKCNKIAAMDELYIPAKNTLVR